MIKYTYKKYLALYEICEGEASYCKLDRIRFEQLDRRFQELVNQDEEEWFTKHGDNCMNVAEAEAEECARLRTVLLISEVERFEAIAKAWGYVEISPSAKTKE